MSKLALRLNSKFPLDKTQPIFMGIDVHKKTLSISLVHQNVLIGQFTIAYDTEALKNLLNRYTDFKIFSVYEAGFSGFHLHFFLESIIQLRFYINNVIVDGLHLIQNPNYFHVF